MRARRSPPRGVWVTPLHPSPSDLWSFVPERKTLRSWTSPKRSWGMPRKKPQPEPEELVATIETVERTYYASQERDRGKFFNDEAILDLVGTIQDISPRHKRFLGHTIEMSFVCARRFKSDSEAPEAKPFLLSIRLKKDRCSFMAYLPADAFWALPAMIASKAVTRIEARFADVRYGSGELLSVYFASPSKLAELATFGAPDPA